MPMTNFERDFALHFPESARAERIITLENRLANEVLTGNYENLSLDSLQERLADTESFWNALQSLIVAYNTKSDTSKQKLDSLMGVISGLAFDVALDATPSVDGAMVEQAKEDFAADSYDRMTA